MHQNEPEIINPKSVTDNTVDMLLTSVGFNKDELKIPLDVIKNAK